MLFFCAAPHVANWLGESMGNDNVPCTCTLLFLTKLTSMLGPLFQTSGLRFSGSPQHFVSDCGSCFGRWVDTCHASRRTGVQCWSTAADQRFSCPIGFMRVCCRGGREWKPQPSCGGSLFWSRLFWQPSVKEKADWSFHTLVWVAW